MNGVAFDCSATSVFKIEHPAFSGTFLDFSIVGTPQLTPGPGITAVFTATLDGSGINPPNGVDLSDLISSILTIRINDVGNASWEIDPPQPPPVPGPYGVATPTPEPSTPRTSWAALAVCVPVAATTGCASYPLRNNKWRRGRAATKPISES
jgi:hypothetical protein